MLRVCWVEGWVGAWSKWRGRVVVMTLFINGASNPLLSLGLLLLSLSLLLPLRSATLSAFVPQPTTELWANKVCVDSAVHTALVADGGTTQIFRLAEALSSLQFHMYVVCLCIVFLFPCLLYIFCLKAV